MKVVADHEEMHISKQTESALALRNHLFIRHFSLEIAII